MKKSLSVLSLMLVLLLFISLASGAPSNWAQPEIQKAQSFNLTTDRILSNYQSNITREEFCELVVKLYEALSGEQVSPVSPNPFIDTTNPEILKANNLGIVKGISQNQFAPNNPVTRQEISVMFFRALNAISADLDTDTSDVSRFADEEQIASWAIDAVRFLYKQGIMKGVGQNVINPLGNTTREEAIALTVRVFENHSGNLLIVHFIDVGQGDAILIQTPEKSILIDAGERGEVVVNYLKAQGVNSLDLVIGTHPHADHIGGLINVLQSIPVREVIDPGIVHTTKTFEDYLTLIDQKDITFTVAQADMTRDLDGGVNMQILHPSFPSALHLNDASVVVKVTFGQVSFMFTGDAEQASETQILIRNYDLNSTILKVGHHGSRTSTSTAFLSAVSPEAAIIMCGTGNTYGHPHEETLAKLVNASVNIYRTDMHGTIVVTTNGQRYDINVKEAYQYTPPKVPEPEPVTRGSYIGSIKSDKYHYPTCRYAETILPENQIWFQTVKDTKDAGYVPCGVCKPPQ